MPAAEWRELRCTMSRVLALAGVEMRVASLRLLFTIVEGEKTAVYLGSDMSRLISHMQEIRSGFNDLNDVVGSCGSY